MASLIPGEACIGVDWSNQPDRTIVTEETYHSESYSYKLKAMAFANGHAIGMDFYHYPHLCPGDECAVQRWLFLKHMKGLKTIPRHVPEAEGQP